LGLAAAGVIDQEAAHRLGRGVVELGFVLERQAARGELEEGLVDEGGGGEAVAWALQGHLAVGDGAQVREDLFGEPVGLRVLGDVAVFCFTKSHSYSRGGCRYSAPKSE